jgi:hypothetical protein
LTIKPRVAVLELLRAEIAEGGVETTGVVNLVDEPRKIVGHVNEVSQAIA